MASSQSTKRHAPVDVAFADAATTGSIPGISLPGSVKSPTGLTNAVRRPKSPRKAPDFLAAESFSRAYNGDADPKVRRRTHEEMGRNGIQIETADSAEDKKFQPRLCMPMGVSELLQLKGGGASGGSSAPGGGGCMTTTVERSKDFMVRYEASAKENFVGTCGGEEHETRNRGHDSEFFKAQADDNSMTKNSSDSGSDPLRDLQLEEEIHKQGGSRSRSVPSSMRSAGKQFPGAIEVTHDSDEISPPRVDRVNTSNFDPKAFVSSQDDMLEARLRLFQKGLQEDTTDPELRLSRALETVTHQERTIESLEEELSFARTKLDEIAAKYEESRAINEKKHKTAVELRARTVETQKMLQEQQSREEKEIERLCENLTQLQTENSTLKIALREAKGSSSANPQSPNVSMSSPPGTPAATGAGSSTQLIALKAEIVDLKAKLAEAHAVNISDHSSLNSSFADVEQLRRQNRRYQKELEDFRRKEKGMDRMVDQDVARQKEISLKQELEKANEEVEVVRQEYEVKLNDAMASEAKTNSEVIKLRALVHRLERERARMRSQSSSSIHVVATESGSLTANMEVDKLKRQLEEEQNSSKNSMNQLRKEIKELRQKLSDSETRADLNKAATPNDAQLSILQDELEFRKANEASLRAELRMHKSLLREARDAILEIDTNSTADHTEIIIDALRVAVRQLNGEIEKLRPFEEQSRKARNEIEERKQVEAELSRQIEILQKKNESLEAVAKDSISNAALEKHVGDIEESFKKKIGSLENRLSHTETQYKQENNRVKELSRILQEKDNERHGKIDELEKELEKMKNIEVQLQTELAQLKLQNTHVPPSDTSSPINDRSSLNEDSALNNVVRLRKELAVARARLATARDQSDFKHSSPGRSTHSGEEESCWAPPAVDVIPSFEESVWSAVSEEGREEKKVNEPSMNSGGHTQSDAEKQEHISRLARKYVDV